MSTIFSNSQSVYKEIADSIPMFRPAPPYNPGYITKMDDPQMPLQYNVDSDGNKIVPMPWLTAPAWFIGEDGLPMT